MRSYRKRGILTSRRFPSVLVVLVGVLCLQALLVAGEGNVEAELARRSRQLEVQTEMVYRRMQWVQKTFDERNKPTNPDYALIEEGSIKLKWLGALSVQVKQSLERAEAASDPRMKMIWLKEARIKTERAERLMAQFVPRATRTAPAVVQVVVSSEGQSSEQVKEAITRLSGIRSDIEQSIEQIKYKIDQQSRTDPSVRKFAQKKYDAMKARFAEAEALLKEAAAAGTQEARDAFLKQAHSAGALAERATEYFLGPGFQYALHGKPKLKTITGFASGILQQMGLHDSRLEEQIQSHDPGQLISQAKKDFGQGRAGAGGVSLHSAARVEGLDPKSLTGITFADNRLSLIGPKGRITLPPLDPEHVVLTLKCAYEGKGDVTGTFVSEESNAVIFQTGKAQFGEVVWKKSFLPEAWNGAKPGERVTLGLGPGIGLLSLPAPSTNRVTYYGPIAGTRMGDILLRADQLMTVLMDGINPVTGHPEKPIDIPGFKTATELRARKALQPPKEAESKEERDPKKWWLGTTWFVWVPDQFTLKLSEDGKSLTWVDHKMKLAIWTAGGEIPEEYVELGNLTTQHYGDLSKRFPVLQELLEVAKATTVVRWMKANHLPLQGNAYKDFTIKRVSTPTTVRDISTYWLSKDGKPWFEEKAKP